MEKLKIGIMGGTFNINIVDININETVIIKLAEVKKIAIFLRTFSLNAIESYELLNIGIILLLEE